MPELNVKGTSVGPCGIGGLELGELGMGSLAEHESSSIKIRGKSLMSIKLKIVPFHIPIPARPNCTEPRA